MNRRQALGFFTASAAGLLMGVAFGAWLGRRRLVRTRWRLDAQGLGLRRDLMWQLETRIPLSRVQHLDLRRGPLERRAGLATLIVHTAGTHNSVVTLPGLSPERAVAIRDAIRAEIRADSE